MAPHSSTLAWKIPWTEDAGGPQSMGSLWVGHDWVTSLSCIGEGNGNPLQHSCLENPRDGGACWAALYGIAQSRTRLKWLSSSLAANRKLTAIKCCYFLLLFSHSVMSDSLWPRRLQHVRLPCPSLSPGVCSNSCPLNEWWHLTISSSVVPFPVQCLDFTWLEIMHCSSLSSLCLVQCLH